MSLKKFSTVALIALAFTQTILILTTTGLLSVNKTMSSSGTITAINVPEIPPTPTPTPTPTPPQPTPTPTPPLITYDCPYCSETFDTLEELIAHVQSQHIVYPTTFDYEVVGSGGTYTGTDFSGTYQPISGSSASLIISTVIGWMSAGQKMKLSGTFSLSGLSVNKAVTLAFSQGSTTGRIEDQATVTCSGTFMTVSSAATIVGGNFIGTATMDMLASNAQYLGCFFKNIKCNYGGSNVYWSYCTWEGTGAGNYIMTNNVGGNHYYWDHCTWKNSATGGIGLFGPDSNPSADHAYFTYCTFDNLGYHNIYLNGPESSGPTVGQCEIAYCNFINMKASTTNFAGIHLKVPNCKIHHNTFRDWAYSSWMGGVAISCYSDYAASEANYNEIYDNVFDNVPIGVLIGQNPSDSPEIGNKIHNNIFINCPTAGYDGSAIVVNQLGDTLNLDTWIYYNKFYGCSRPFGQSTSPVQNMVIAYNEFWTDETETVVNTVSSSIQSNLQGLTNTMIYGNIGMSDFNVPSPPPV